MMRTLIATAALVAVGACTGQPAKGPPARLVTGVSDTAIVHNQRPVQLQIRVLDAAGRLLRDTGVRYQWSSGLPVAVSATGVATCAQAGDATVRASLGALATHFVLRCRPVREVRALRMMNIVLGDSAHELPFEAVGVDGWPVTLLTGQITVSDSTIVTVEGQRIRGRAPGHTDVTMRVGDHSGFMSVHVYERGATPDGMRPGQHVAVPVRLAGGEMRRWRLSAARELYLLTMLPEGDDRSTPELTIVGANCARILGSHFVCVAQRDASVYAYNPQQAHPGRELRGTLAVWRQERP